MVHIGVPAEERALPQRLEADLRLWPAQPLADLEDEVERTVDYGAVAMACRAEAEARERKLIETLAEDLCRMLLQRWKLWKVEVCIKKWILPDTGAVSVTLSREPADFPPLPET